MVYASWEVYQGVYRGGVVPRAAFGQVVREASRWLDMLTFGRIGKVYARDEAVQLACCAVCEVLYRDGAGDGGAVVREKVGDVEMAYAAQPNVGLKRRVLDAARVYLWRTGLLSMAVTGAGRDGG